ncbi:MAG: hypothetical protein QNJ94_02125 [Alphaproteobacteria bacterium]|nr:hypothetical protein [Alphaproteobacteria bacterium]
MHPTQLLGQWTRAIALAALACGLLVPFHVAAQVSPETVAKLQTLDQDLRSENRFVRLAALESALQSDRVLFRKLAYDVAFGGDDTEMQALALRFAIKPNRIYPVRLIPTDTRKSQDRARELIGINLRVVRYDPQTGQIGAVLGKADTNMSGAINGNHLELAGSYCQLALKVAGASFLRGDLRCYVKTDIAVSVALD